MNYGPSETFDGKDSNGYFTSILVRDGECKQPSG